MPAEPAAGLMPSRPQDLLNQLYENTPVKQQQEQQLKMQEAQPVGGGFDLLGGDDGAMGGGAGFGVQIAAEAPKDDLWGNNLVNIDNIEDENTNKSNQAAMSAFPGVPMS